VIPDLPVACAAQVDVSDVGAIVKVVGEDSHELMTQVFVEEELHATELVKRRRERRQKPRPREYLRV
jgi:hypothetical protein